AFDPDSLWYVQRWYLANDLLRGRWRRKSISASDHLDTRPVVKAEPERSPHVRVDSEYRRSQVYSVAESSAIREGGRLSVEFNNLRVLILRRNGRLLAFSGKCPHGPYFLEDGHHDECTLTCPGHGLQFDIQSGRTPVDRYRLVSFEVYETDGTV